MNTSSRLVVGTHILSVLAIGQEKQIGAIKSEQMAESVNTNPVVVRRILGMLRNAGLVASRSGPHGGSVLSRDPAGITLKDVYIAVEEGTLFHLHYSTPGQACPVGKYIQPVLCGIFSEAEEAMKAVLETRTIADVMRCVMDKAGCEAEPKQHDTTAESLPT